MKRGLFSWVLIIFGVISFIIYGYYGFYALPVLNKIFRENNVGLPITVVSYGVLVYIAIVTSVIAIFYGWFEYKIKRQLIRNILNYGFISILGLLFILNFQVAVQAILDPLYNMANIF